jgi:hypothetical protein
MASVRDHVFEFVARGCRDGDGWRKWRFAGGRMVLDPGLQYAGCGPYGAKFGMPNFEPADSQPHVWRDVEGNECLEPHVCWLRTGPLFALT